MFRYSRVEIGHSVVSIFGADPLVDETILVETKIVHHSRIYWIIRARGQKSGQFTPKYSNFTPNLLH